jgi:flagellar biosynthesis protein FlhF
MDVRTFRAPTMQEALALVRRELGPDAAVLHTRELRGSPWLRWIPGLRQIEVTAALNVNVPSRLATREAARTPAAAYAAHSQQHASLRPAAGQTRPAFEQQIKGQLDELHSLVADLCRRTQGPGLAGLPEVLFRVYTDLIDAEVDQILAGELIAALRQDPTLANVADPVLVKARLVRMLENELRVAPPLDLSRGRRVAALVGPTGVGKTTTIAKLAANFRLQQRKRVGLITVDTYRIAAVEQLRTYAEIIELPMEVVSTPREMRQAVQRLSPMDLVLIDTAGRSPKDEVRIQELKTLLAEAAADDVFLVLSAVTHAAALARTAERFAEAGTTALILTKLDEAAGMGQVLPLLRACKLPLCYLTDGQNVPDDIAPADARRVARLIVGLEQG